MYRLIIATKTNDKNYMPAGVHVLNVLSTTLVRI